MLEYFVFKLRQLFRYTSAAGGSLFILIPFALVSLYYLSKILTTIGVEGAQIMVALILLTLGLKRKDIIFLVSVFKNMTFFVLVLEYSILYLVLQLFAISTHGIDLAMVFPLLLVFIMAAYQSLFRSQTKRFFIIRKLSSILPLHAFEWKSGIRQNPFLFFLSYIIGIVLVFFFPITPIIMLYWMTFSGEFYAYIEDRAIVQSYRTRKNFYLRKISSILLVCNLLFLPHYILYVYLYSGPQIMLLFVSIVLFNMVFLYAFLLKYTLRIINNKVQNTLPITFYFVMIAILPLSLYLIYRIWRMNQTKLSQLLS